MISINFAEIFIFFLIFYYFIAFFKSYQQASYIIFLYKIRLSEALH